MEHIERELRKFVIDNFLFGEGETGLSNEGSFLEKGLVDSMGILTLVAFVQEKYAITVADGDLVPEHWDSVKRIAEFVQSKMAITR
jgi:acyl carrier protein